jgi:hypothetical protein
MNKLNLIEIGQHTYLGIFNQNKEKVIYLTQNETIVNQSHGLNIYDDNPQIIHPLDLS